MAIQAIFLGSGVTTNVPNIVATSEGYAIGQGEAPVDFYLLQDTESDDAGIVWQDRYGRMQYPCFCSCTDWPERVETERRERNRKNYSNDGSQASRDGKIAQLLKENREQLASFEKWESGLIDRRNLRLHGCDWMYRPEELRVKLDALMSEVAKLQERIAQAEVTRSENKQFLASEVLPMPTITPVRLVDLVSGESLPSQG